MKTGIDALSEFRDWVADEMKHVDHRRATYKAGTIGAKENKAAYATLWTVKKRLDRKIAELETEIPPFD